MSRPSTDSPIFDHDNRSGTRAAGGRRTAAPPRHDHQGQGDRYGDPASSGCSLHGDTSFESSTVAGAGGRLRLEPDGETLGNPVARVESDGRPPDHRSPRDRTQRPNHFPATISTNPPAAATYTPEPSKVGRSSSAPSSRASWKVRTANPAGMARARRPISRRRGFRAGRAMVRMATRAPVVPTTRSTNPRFGPVEGPTGSNSSRAAMSLGRSGPNGPRHSMIAEEITAIAPSRAMVAPKGNP